MVGEVGVGDVEVVVLGGGKDKVVENDAGEHSDNED